VAVSSRLTWLGIARETYPGMAQLPVAAVPVDQSGYEPEDTPSFLLDTGVRSSMGQVAGAVPGTLSSVLGFSGPLYPGSSGWWLDNLLGDTSAVPGGTLGTAQPLAAPLNIGDTSLTVATSLGAVGVNSVIVISDGNASEVMFASAGSSGTTPVFAAFPCRFPHSTFATAALQTVANGYTHTFAALNAGTGQPPSHTLTDTTGLVAGTLARAYPYAVVTQMDLAGDPGAGWVTAKVSGVAWPSQPSAAVVAWPQPPYVAPFAGWQSVVTTGGSVPYAGRWSVSMKRQTVAYRSAQNSLQAWIIARGPLVVTGTLDYPDPSDETPLSQMTSGAQPAVQIALAYGVASFTVTCSQVQFTKSKADRTRVALGYGNAFQALDNSTDAGGSGGLSPVQVTVQSLIPAY
jgi:hypothetical protein